MLFKQNEEEKGFLRRTESTQEQEKLIAHSEQMCQNFKKGVIACAKLQEKVKYDKPGKLLLN